MKKNSGRFRVRELLLAGLLGLTACSAKRAPRSPRQDADDWLRSVREARATIQTLKAEARVEVRRKERRFRFETSMLVAFPGHLYAEVNGIGLVGAVVSADEESVLAYLPTRNKAYRSNGSEILGRLFGIEQSTREWVSLLLGEPPPFRGRVISFVDVGKESVLELGDKIPRVTLRFDRATSWLRSYEETSPIRRKIIYGKPIETTAGSYPSEIRIETEQASVEFRFSKVSANVRILPELFRIDLPVKVVPAPIDGGEILRKDD
ncbi:MAG: hypothetical protein V1495_01665 [Pseudomonadota bacterium]